MSELEALKYLEYPQQGDNIFSGVTSKPLYWAPDPEEGFIDGELIEETATEYILKTESGKKITVSKKLAEHKNPSKFDGVGDLAELPELNQPSVLHNLRLRYLKNVIYTYSGLFCVVVNPYHWLPIYTEPVIKFYKGKTRSEVPPHVYAVADNAYRNMLNSKSNQAILITGESGAGKTENTKKVIQYMAVISGRSGGDGDLEQQILNTNPLLEAFGNAKTLKNNNSSRFGKFIELQFDKLGQITGSSIRSYLLEKSRVMSPGINERTFHIFYEIIAGSTPEEKKRWKLTTFADFNNLKATGCFEADGIDDVKDFKATRAAMQIMEITPEEQEEVLRMVAAILHLGNIKFKATRGAVECESPDAMKNAADLLGVGDDKLEQALLHPQIRAGGVDIKRDFTVEQATDARDALAKAIYSRMFDWLVMKINNALSNNIPANFIGVLDIAGFEIFQKNSFEQMCINYTNERLQQFFNNHMFKLEQEEYAREKIQWEMMDFGLDLQPTIDLIDMKPNGILPTLEEQCTLQGQSTDEKFVEELNKKHEKNPKFGKVKFTKVGVAIRHYAGEVTYDCSMWLNKNRDPLESDLQTLMQKSSVDLLKTVFSETHEIAMAAKLAKISGSTRNLLERGGPAGLAARGRTGTSAFPGKKAARFQFVSQKYKEQLNELMDILYACEPHFIRCIVPNRQKKQMTLENDLIIDQLKCNGVLEGIRICRKGYPSRVPYEIFAKQYDVLCHQTTANAKDACQNILKFIKTKPEQFQYGLTKVFFRTGELARIEELRQDRLSQLVIKIQSWIRGYIQRKRFAVLKLKWKAAEVLQRNLRLYLDIKQWVWWQYLSKVRDAMPMLKAGNKLKQTEEDLEATKNKLKNSEKEKEEAAQARAALLADKAKLERDQDELKKQYEEKDELANALSVKIENMAKQIRELESDAESMRANVEDKDGMVGSLQNKLRQYEADLSETRDRLGFEENERRKQQERATALDADKDDLTLKLKNALDEKARLQKEIARLQQQVTDLTAALDNEKKLRQKVEQAKKTLETQLAQKTEEVADREKKIAEKEDKIKSMEADLATGESARASQVAAKKKLEGRIAALETEIDDERTKNKQAAEKTKQLHAVEIEELKNQLEEEEERAKTIESEKTALVAQIDELNKQRESDKKAMENQSKGISQSKEEYNNLAAALDEQKKSAAALDKQKKQLADQVEQLTQQLDASEKAKSNLEKAKKKAEQDLAAEKNRAATAEDVNGQNAARFAEYESKIQNIEDQLEEERARADRAAKTSKKFEVEKQGYEDNIAQLLKQMDKKDKEIKRLQASIEEDKDTIDTLNEQSSTLEQQLAADQVTIDDLKKKLKAAEDARSSVEKNYNEVKSVADASKADIDNINAAKTLLEKNNKKLQADIEQLQKDAADNENKLKAERDKLKKKYDDDLKATKKQLEDQAAGSNSSQQTLLALQAEKQELQDNVEMLQRDKANADRLRKKAEADTTAARDETALAIANKNKAEAQVKDLTTKYDEMKEQLEDAEDEIQKLKAVNGQLATDLETLRRQSDARVEIEKLSAQNQRLTAEIEEMTEIGNEERLKAKTEYESMKRKYQEELDSVSIELDNEKKSKQSSDKALKKAEQDAKDAKIANDDLNKKIAALTDQLNRTTNEKMAVEEELEDANNKISKALSKARQAEEATAASRETADVATKAKAAAEARVAQLTSENEELKEALEIAEQASGLKDELKKRDADIVDLKSQLQAAGDRERDLKKSMSTRVEEARQQAQEEAATRESALQRSLSKVQQELADAQSQNDSSAIQVQTLTNNVNKSKKEIDSLKSENERLNREQADANDKVSKLQKELADTRALLVDAESRAKMGTDKIKKQMQAEMEAAISDAENRGVTRAKELEAKLRDEMAALRTQLEEEQRARLAADAETKRARADADEAKRNLENSSSAVAKYDKDVKKLKRDNDEMREALEEFESKLNAEQRAKKKVQTELDEMKANLERVVVDKDEAEKARKRGDKEIKDLKAKADAEKTIKTNLENENKKLQEAARNNTKISTRLQSDIRRLKERLDDVKAAKKRYKSDVSKYRVEKGLTALPESDEEEEVDTPINRRLSRSRTGTSVIGDDEASIHN